jgi:hypothetical protein
MALRPVDGSLIRHEHKVTGQGDVLDANRKVEGSFQGVKDSLASTFGAGGMAAIAANQALQLASSVGALAGSFVELAKSGAAARDVARTFAGLGDAVPAIESLRASVAGVVDDTTLQQFALFGESMGLAAEQSTGLAQRLTVLAEEQGKLSEISEILGQAQESPKEAFKKLGVIIDDSTEQYQGLSEAQKNLLIIQEQSALGTQEQVDAMESAQVAVLGVSAKMANLQSTMEETLSSVLEGSGIFDLISTAIDGASGFIQENSSLFEAMGDIVTKVGGIIGRILAPALERLSFWLEAGLVLIEPFIDGIGLLLDGVDALGSVIPDLNDAAGALFITDMPTFTSNTAKQVDEQASWLDITIKNTEALQREREERAEVQRQIELSKKDRQEENRLKVLAIEAAEREAQQLGAALKVREGLAAATDAAVDKYGSEEDALKALGLERQRFTSAMRDAAAIANDFLVAENAQQEEVFRARQERLQKDAAITQQIIEQLGNRIIAEDTAADAITRTTTALTSRNEAVQESIDLGAMWADAHQSVFGPIRQRQIDQLREWGVTLTEVWGREQEIEEQRRSYWVDQTTRAQQTAEQNAAIAGSFSAIATSMGHLGAASDSYIGQATALSGAFGSMVKGLDTAGDSTASAVAAVAGASAEMAGSVFDSTTAQAALLSIFYGAQGLGLLPNVAAAAPKFAASGAMAIAAGMSFAGSGGARLTGGAGAGGGGAAASAPAAADAGFGTAFDRAPRIEDGAGGGTSVNIYLMSPNSRDAAPVLADWLNEGARSGSGIRLDSSLIEGM